MSFQNVTQLALGNFLQIAFIDGVHKQIATTYPEWELVERMKVGSTDGREAKFLLQTALGTSAVQYRNPGVRSNFPGGAESQIKEGTIVYKELDATIELEYNLYRRIIESKSKYDASALAMEVDSKTTAMKRQLCIDFYGDGSGAIATISSATVVGGDAVISCRSAANDVGFAGSAQFGEVLINVEQDGTPGTLPTVASGTVHHLRVVARDPRSAVNTITVQAEDAGNNVLTITAFAPAAGEVLYKGTVNPNDGQPTKPDLTNTSLDLATQSEAIIGLRGLIRNDGRTVHGIAQRGAVAGTVFDNGGAAIDLNAIEQSLNQVKNAVGEGKYKWDSLLCNREVRSAFIDARETDRRFMSIEDHKRGLNKFVYVHQDDSVTLQGSEFCDHKNAYLLPVGKTDGQKVLQFRGTDIKPAKAENGDVFMFAPGTGGYHQRLMVSYMSGMGQLLSLHPAATVRITNFSLGTPEN